MKMGQYTQEYFHLTVHDADKVAIVCCTSEPPSQSWEAIRKPMLDLGLIYRPICIAQNVEYNQLSIAVRDTEVDRAELLRRLNAEDEEGEGWEVNPDGVICSPFTNLSPREVCEIGESLFSQGRTGLA